MSIREAIRGDCCLAMRGGELESDAEDDKMVETKAANPVTAPDCRQFALSASRKPGARHR